MRCDQAQSLFDAYLDGELSPSMERELGAHRVSCPDCRRELALLEVTGRLIESDEEPVGLRDGFTDRLIACVDESHGRDTYLRRLLYIGGPLAAAAVVGLAFLGFFDPGGETRRAGVKVVNETQPAVVVAGETTDEGAEAIDPLTGLPADSSGNYDLQKAEHRELEQFFNDIRSNMSDKQTQFRSLHDSLDLTVRQWLYILNERTDPNADDIHYPGSEGRDGEASSTDRHGDIEDL
ncbi:MAG: zf-HC2 domain-containing protein [Planctomycetota bacterium]|jgi:hypothetical protein